LFDKEDGPDSGELDDLRCLAKSIQCTIRHDKMYGLMGMLPRSVSSKVTVDYRGDETGLLAEFAAAISVTISVHQRHNPCLIYIYNFSNYYWYNILQSLVQAWVPPQQN
jgi:hypothetical protein